MFAVIGDYGQDNAEEAAVSEMVKSWSPAFVVTVGDNNYGGASAIDDEIGKYYAEYIGNYKGTYGPGSATNRFWPSTGNHDWDSADLTAYVDYFTLPGNERYYEKRLGLVHLFAVDSDEREPDGNTESSKQGKWLQEALAASDACHKLVAFHHPSYSSAEHGSEAALQWPFAAWGANGVLTGHDHVYERLESDTIPYFVNGLGGAETYQFVTTLSQSKVRYNASAGAMRVTATKTSITYEAWSTNNTKIDSLTMPATCP